MSEELKNGEIQEGEVPGVGQEEKKEDGAAETGATGSEEKSEVESEEQESGEAAGDKETT